MGTPVTIGDTEPTFDRVTGLTNQMNNITLQVVDDKIEITIGDEGIVLDVRAAEIMYQTMGIMLRTIYRDTEDDGL